jgi:hypothetical protein
MGKVLRVPLRDPRLAAAVTVVPESSVAIQYFVPTAHRLYVVDQDGGPSQVRVFQGSATPTLSPLDPVSSVSGLLHATGDDVLVRSGTFLSPAWRAFQPPQTFTATCSLPALPTSATESSRVYRPAAARKSR